MSKREHDEPGGLEHQPSRVVVLAAGGSARADESRDDSSDESVPGEAPRIGRFTVLRKLGEGGMGVVFSAYDDELDRRIALKLVNNELRDQSESSGRLLREAQAMAKLSHPNVAQVYEFGDFRGQIFIAMEYVDGPPLDVWACAPASGDPGGQPDGAGAADTARAERRSWREILAMHVQAGAGLSAAHRAGLIHRDYKPANVLVGADGRARVLDFGLVRAHRRDGEEGSGRSALDRSITKSGSVLGTPAYMSLEQLVGDPADERSDQFAFCVALYEALYGRHPFTDDGVGRVAHIMRGNIREPRADTEIPGRVYLAIARGLSADRKERWPSMDDLLAELTAVVAHGRSAELDLRVSHRQRQAVFWALAGLTGLGVVPASVPGVGPPWLRTPLGAVVIAAVLNAVLLGLVAVSSRSLLRNRINRWITYWLLLLVSGLVLGRAVGLALDEPYPHLFLQEDILLTVGTSIGGLMIVRWLWLMAGLWFAVGAASAVVVAYAPMLNAGGMVVSCLLALFYSRQLQMRSA